MKGLSILKAIVFSFVVILAIYIAIPYMKSGNLEANVENAKDPIKDFVGDLKNIIIETKELPSFEPFERTKP